MLSEHFECSHTRRENRTEIMYFLHDSQIISIGTRKSTLHCPSSVNSDQNRQVFSLYLGGCLWKKKTERHSAKSCRGSAPSSLFFLTCLKAVHVRAFARADHMLMTDLLTSELSPHAINHQCYLSFVHCVIAWTNPIISENVRYKYRIKMWTLVSHLMHLPERL